MQKYKNIWILAIGLFSIFFGAGNLIFPALLGANSGEYWWFAVSIFSISDAGFALLAIVLLSYFGSLDAFGEKVGRKFFKIYTFVAVLVFGLFIFPRTASTTYEISFQNFLPESFNTWYFYIIYFTVVLLLTIKPSKIFDNIAKYFGPLLIGSILFLIISGIVMLDDNTKTNISTTKTEIVKSSFIAGYQTMDMLGCLLQASFAVSILTLKGYKNKEERHYLISRAAVISMILLCVIYFSLAYLGSRIGSEISENASAISALLYISQKIWGRFGEIILGFSVFIACFSTSIGVLGIVSDFMATYIKKVSYKIWAITFSILGAMIAYRGVDFIIIAAIPALQAVYPVLIVISFMHLFKIQNAILFKIASYTTLVFSLLDVLVSLKVSWAHYIVHMLPLGSVGFVWLPPTIISLGIGFFILKTKKQKA